MRTSDIDGAAGSKEEIERIVTQIRVRWPSVRIVLRGDSGFAREERMAWCEQNGVDFVLGLARNSRLVEKLEPQFERLDSDPELERLFRDFRYRTLDSWSRTRRVVGKAQYSGEKANPRFRRHLAAEEGGRGA